jgi:hypothetical protein
MKADAGLRIELDAQAAEMISDLSEAHVSHLLAQAVRRKASESGDYRLTAEDIRRAASDSGPSTAPRSALVAGISILVGVGVASCAIIIPEHVASLLDRFLLGGAVLGLLTLTLGLFSSFLLKSSVTSLDVPWTLRRGFPARKASVDGRTQAESVSALPATDVTLHRHPSDSTQHAAGSASERFLPTLRRAVQPHPPRSDAEMVIDYRALRAVIGGIVLLLVPVVYFGNWVFFSRHVGACLVPNPRLPDSLSGYYYSHMRNLFVGAMCAVGIFLAAYRGYDRWDNRFTNVAGLAAICIALCPTMPPSYAPNGPNLFFTSANLCGPSTPLIYQQSSSQRSFGYVHDVALLALFAMVFLMVLFQFTRTGEADDQVRGDPAGGIRAWWNSLFSRGFCAWRKSLFSGDQTTARKKRRNRIYVICAGCIFLCAMLAVAAAISPSAESSAHLLLFAEAGAFLFFGVAWYVKGAASAPANHPQLFVWALSRTARRWLADDPRTESVGGSELATAERV